MAVISNVVNNEIEETGLGAAVMNHPGHGIRWVCRRFAPRGIGLEPGQVILSGSFTRPVIVRAGDHIRADYGPLGNIDWDDDFFTARITNITGFFLHRSGLLLPYLTQHSSFRFQSIPCRSG